MLDTYRHDGTLGLTIETQPSQGDTMLEDEWDYNYADDYGMEG